MVDKKNSASKIKKIVEAKNIKAAEKRRKRVIKNLVIISVFVIFASFIWVMLEGYHLLLSKEMVEESGYLIEPLDPEIDSGLISESQKKKFFSLEEVDNYYKSLSQSLIILDQEVTESAQLESESSSIDAQ